jgi:hypothetical protein
VNVRSFRPLSSYPQNKITSVHNRLYYHTVNAEEIEEVIDTLTERLAALSQNDIDAYLESFRSDDDASCSSDLNDSNDV